MKKIFTLLMLTSLVSLSSNAQCPSGAGNCTPDPTTPSATFKPTPENYPCAIQNVSFNETESFTIPATMTISGVGTVDIDSVEFQSFSNLPCGLCYSFNKASKHYSKNETGCFSVFGKTAEAVGQYTVDIKMQAWLKGNTAPQPPVYSSVAGLAFYVRVAASSGSCAALNTSNPGLTASKSCPLGIAELAKDIHALTVVPNPMHSSSTLNFESDKAGVYTMNVIDVLGKIVATKEVKVAAGINQVVVERNDLIEGVYFVQIANGKSIATTKFVIAD